MKAVLFDTETTDLIRSKHRPLAAQPHVTEFFGMVLELGSDNQWTETGHYSQLFNPTIPLTPEVQRITGLNDRMLADQPKFVECASEVKQLIESCDIAVAHNLGFDRSMLDIEMQRSGMALNWQKLRLICTVEATEHFLGRRLKLIELHQYLFNEPFENAHRAEHDVRPMARCFIKLWEMGVL